MKYVTNERGYTFMYVLMIFAVLTIVTPVLINVVSSERLLDSKDSQSGRIEQYAVSGVESLIDYLNDFTGGNGSDRIGYFNNYPGWGTKYIHLPEGNVLNTSLELFTIENGVRTVLPSSQQPPDFVPPASKNIGVRMKVEMEGTGLSTTVDYGVTVDSDPDPVNDNPLISEIPSYPGPDGVITPAEIPPVPGMTPEQAYDNFFDSLIPSTFDYTVTGFCGWESAMLDASSKNMEQAAIKVTGTSTIVPQACSGGKSKGTYDYTQNSNTIFVVYINTSSVEDYSQTNGQYLIMNGMLLVDGNVDLRNISDLQVDDFIVGEQLNIVNKTEITGDNIAAKQYDGGNKTTVHLDPSPNPDYNYPTDSPGGGTGGGAPVNWNPIRL